MNRLSFKVAFGGIVAALALLLMFLSGAIPLGVYCFPMLSGLLLLAVSRETGEKAAVVCYAAISLLSMIITPDWEAKLMFIFILGYYPILREKYEKIKLFPLRAAAKLLNFNAAVISAYLIMIYVFRLDAVIKSLGEFGEYTVWIMLAAANVFFVIYDLLVKNLSELYDKKLRKLLHRRLK